MTKGLEKSGVVSISEAEYNAHPFERNSDLGYLLQSPAHYWHHKNAPKKPKDCFEFGTAAHLGVLEPKRFYNECAALSEGCDLRTTKGKAEKAALAEAGKRPLKAEDYHAIERIIDAVYSHPTASKYLSGGVVEHAVFWKDQETGVGCKAKPDYYRTADNIYIDLKTTDNASLDAFERSAFKWGYPRQAAFYQDGIRAATGRQLSGTVFIAVEYQEPYGVSVFMPDDLMIEYGRQQYRQCLSILKKCQAANSFPGYPEGTQVLALPRWA